jgi:serine/threonine protein kinase/tetratricopeptide (TPR) repeat protein
MSKPAPDRDLLFGLLALQNGLVNQGQLVAAFQAWTLEKGRPLAEHLVGRGELDLDDCRAVEALVTRHVKKHGGDVEKSLAAVSAGKSTRESLARIGDPQIEATLGHVGSAGGSTEDGDVDSTTSYAVGSATSDGARFRVLRPHARGGLGAVFVALDSELNREVALKQILAHHADDPVSRQRFLIEAEITGGLEHPGIVPVYGLGAYADGRPYYAMRFIKGESLKEAIERFHGDDTLKRDSGRRSLVLRQFLRRFMDVCNAVEYAHSRGVLHRDIKPANIIVGKHGETLVVDWGLGKTLGQPEPEIHAGERKLVLSSASGSAETLPGSALGTPAYMSPEQSYGDLDRMGPRSDVYSLGATLYCLLTGRPPFEGNDVGKVLRDVQQGDFPPPRQLDPSIDKALEAVCKKAMATKPEDRYDSCHALAADIERWTADVPVTSWNEPFTRRARRWMNRNRTAVTSAAAAVMVALAGLGAVVAVQAQANGALTAMNARLYESNARVSRANAELSTANEKITQANAELTAEREKVQARFDLARDAIRLFHGEVSEDLLLKEKQFEDLRHKLLRGAAEFYGKLEALLQGQRDRVSRAALGQAYDELGDLTARIGNQPEALGVHKKALAVRRSLAAGPEADAKAALDVAKSLTAVGLLSRQTGDTPGALAAFEEARGLADGAVAPTGGSDEAREVLGTSHYQIARLLSIIGKPSEALKALDQALAIRRTLADANPAVTRFQSDVANSHNLVGYVLSYVGKQSEALEAYGRSLAILRTLVDANPAVIQYQSDLARCYNNVGAILSRTNKKTEALKPLGEALAIRQKLADANPAVTEFQSDVAFSHDNISGVLSNIGKLSEALAESGQALAIRQKLADTNASVTQFQSNLARSHTGMAFLLYQHNKRSEALKSFNEAMVIQQRLVDANPTVTDFQNDLARCLANIGDLLAKEGRISETLATLEKGLSISVKLADAHPEFPAYQTQAAITSIDLGMLKADHGDPVAGLRLCRGALDRLTAIKAPQIEELYMLARAHAMIGELLARAPSDPSRDPTDAPAAHFDAAMAVLHRAVALGFRDPVNMPTDRAIDALRSRPDFQVLMMDLAMPKQPFAP